MAFWVIGTIVVMVMGFGALIGWTCANAAFEQRSRAQAEVQRKINADRKAVQLASEVLRELKDIGTPHQLRPHGPVDEPTIVEGQVLITTVEE